ncbi:MAG: ABC transporter permease [Clostridiaceae bacterium]|nr:ABC transporter permease [Clostridiaceae bacterium]
MNPLSTFKYIKSNMRKTLPILISMLVGVFLIYLFSLITKSTSEMVNITQTNFFNKYTTVYSNNEEALPQNLLDRVSLDSNVTYVLPYKPVDGYLSYTAAFGGISISILNLQGEDIPKLLESLSLNLIQGVLPKKNAEEVIIHKRYALQNKLKVGDYIGSEVSLTYGLKGKYKISGIVDGPTMINIINEEKEKGTKDKILKQAILIRVKDIKNKDLINYLTKNAPKNIVITDYDSIYKQMIDMLSILDTLAVSLTGCIILVLCISLGNLNYISFLNRKYEFGVLSAIGYKKTSLYFKLWKENSYVCLIGYVAGIIVTTIIAVILNIAVFEPNGKLIPIWSASGVLTALCIPIFVSFLSLIAPVKELRRTDPLDIIGGSI